MGDGEVASWFIFIGVSNMVTSMDILFSFS